MNMIANTILSFCFSRHLQGFHKHELIFSKFQSEYSISGQSTVRSAIDCLESDGLIYVVSVAIGYAVVELTDYGIDFMSQN